MDLVFFCGQSIRTFVLDLGMYCKANYGVKVMTICSESYGKTTVKQMMKNITTNGTTHTCTLIHDLIEKNPKAVRQIMVRALMQEYPNPAHFNSL